ncbi:MAG: hypothetical protein MH252_16335 [Thermosynechococcaceae cyanobacterium MS004]|nr:hypothetical protein [Thermosynechococcaceae cyanobacterium MS004]
MAKGRALNARSQASITTNQHLYRLHWRSIHLQAGSTGQSLAAPPNWA